MLVREVQPPLIYVGGDGRLKQHTIEQINILLFQSTFYLPTVFLSCSSLFLEFVSCESQGSRCEQIDLGQPITATIPDGIPPGCARFWVCKSARRLSCVSRYQLGLLRCELRCITPGVKGTRDVFVCEHYRTQNGMYDPIGHLCPRY